MHSHVRISRFTYSDATVLTIDGEFDLASVNSVATPAEESILTRRQIVFDLSACTLIDSSALRFLLQVARLPDVPMAIVVGESPIRSTFAVMSIDEGMPAFPTLQDALHWLAGRGRSELAGGTLERIHHLARAVRAVPSRSRYSVTRQTLPSRSSKTSSSR